MFPHESPCPAPSLPHGRGFPARGVLSRAPTSPVASASLWMVLSVGILDLSGQDHEDLPGSSDASVSTRAVPLDPAGLPVALPVAATFPWPSTCSSVSASGHLSRGSFGFTCVTARVSPCLRFSPCRYLHEPKTRFPVRWLALAGAGIAPAGSAGLSLAHQSILRYRRLRHIWLYGQWP